MAKLQPKTAEQVTNIDRDICKGQGNLFKYASEQGYMNEDFVKQYVHSEFCNDHMDTDCDYYQMAYTPYNLEVLLDEIHPAKIQEEQYNDMFFIGYMYQYMHIRTGIPTPELYKHIPYETMALYCDTSFVQDPEETLYDLAEEYDILKGVVVVHE